MLADGLPKPIAPDLATPEQLTAAFKRARYYARWNLWVAAMLHLRVCFNDAGRTVTTVDRADAKKPRVKSWVEKHGGTIADYLDGAWKEFGDVSNVVTAWHREGEKPLILPIEKTCFVDRLGFPKLTYRPDWTEQEKKQLPEQWRNLLNRVGEIDFSSKEAQALGLKFSVLRSSCLGDGYGWPALCSLFAACASVEGIEAGDAVLGESARELIEQHWAGHEIKTQHGADPRTHYLTDKRRTAIEAALKLTPNGGRRRMVTQFDQGVRYSYVDTKFFDQKKYDGFERRLAQWAMPLPQMLATRGGVAPFLLRVLRAQVLKAREQMLRYVIPIISDKLAPPAPITIRWNNRILTDERLAVDLLKFGLTQGPLSQQTFRDESGYDNDEEIERKKVEAGMELSLKAPAYDGHHGFAPGKGNPTADPAGRKPGSPNQA